MQRPPNLEVHVVLSQVAAFRTRPAIVKHSRFCARAGSTWKSPPTITSSVVADASWQTTENNLRLHSLSHWLENQYPLATAIDTPSNSVTMPATKRPGTIPSSENWVAGSCNPQSNGPSRATPARGLPPPQSNCGCRLCRPAVQGKRSHPLFRHHTLASSQRSGGI